MEKITQIKHTLEWHHPDQGKFTAVIINGQIAELNLCEAGNLICLTSTNEIYLRSVHQTLTELLNFIDKEQECMGYKFSESK